ncbi:MAG TPA: PAS domain S-box protein [Geobacteraceae bacterium]|nr:PAS domain S-box protein [Geobacteraceae bacterium]
MLLLTSFPLIAETSRAAKRVLVINSYHSGLSWTDSIMNGVRDGFDRGGIPVEMSAEYLDARRFPDAENSRRIREGLALKLRGMKPDLVVVSDNAALDFVLERRAGLFPDVPVVFCGINHYSPSLIAGVAQVTGVAEDVSVAETVRLALRMHPGTKEIIVIGRTTVTADKANRDSFASALPGLPLGTTFTFWDDLPLPELRARLARLATGSVVFINGLLRDEGGREMMYGESTEWVSRHASVPLYSLWDVYLGHGIVGGKLVSAYHQGRLAAEQAVRILRGESAGRIRVISAQDANNYAFDYRQMKRFGISPSHLPAGSVTVNRPDSFYTQNRMLIWTYFGVIFGLGVFVVILTVILIRQRRVEEQLRRANMVLENSPAVLFRWRAAEGWPVELVSANVSQFGYTQEELLSGTVPFSFLIHPDDLERVASEVAEFASGGVDRFQQEYRLIAKDGTVRWIDERTVVERDRKGYVTHFQGIVLDITERKSAVEALRKSEERMRLFFERQLVGMAITSPEKGWVKVNDKLCRMLGYTADELSRMSWAEVTYLDDLPADTACFDRLLAGEIDDYSMEKRFVRKDGTILHANLSVGCVRTDHGSVEYLLGLIEDISHRKLAEEALRLSERKYRDIVENAPVGIYRSTLDGRFMSVNPAMAHILKYDTPEELIEAVDRNGMAEAIYARPERRSNIVGTSLRNDGWNICEEQFRCKDGSIVTLNLHHRSALIIDSDAIEFEGFGEDVTERKKAEYALRESEEKFRVLAETAPPAIVLYQGDRFVYVNPAMCRITGYSEAELLAMNNWEWAPEEDWDLLRERGGARLKGEQAPSQYEQRVLTKDGEIRWVIVSAGAVDFQGKPAAIATLLDITEAKRVEEKLRQSEEMLFTAFRTSLDSVSINRMSDGLFLAVNDGFCTIMGYGADEVIGRTSQDLNLWVNPEDRERLVREITLHGLVKRMEMNIRRKDGSIFFHQLSARRIVIDGIPSMVIIGRDITEQKLVDRQLRASLAEKTVLLKEVHHRVKNNLQIISSLLELQSDFIADEESRKFLRESRSRIASMALVHEKLYQSESVASINLGDYIESLTHYLFSTFVKDTERIGLTLDLEDVPLAIDEAIPCGLVVNELVSNAFKHAFPQDEQGEIAVRCRCEEDGMITLTVSDNGVGLPPGFDMGSCESLGLQLVTMLVKQLRGRMSLDSETVGTTVVVSFPGRPSTPAP